MFRLARWSDAVGQTLDVAADVDLARADDVDLALLPPAWTIAGWGGGLGGGPCGLGRASTWVGSLLVPISLGCEGSAPPLVRIFLAPLGCKGSAPTWLRSSSLFVIHGLWEHTGKVMMALVWSGRDQRL